MFLDILDQPLEFKLQLHHLQLQRLFHFKSNVVALSKYFWT